MSQRPEMQPSGAIFFDTSAFYAVSDRESRQREPASVALARLIRERQRLLTTNFVIAELHALLLARGGRHVALRVVQELRRSPSLTIERVGEVDELRAWEIIEQYEDKEFSFVDAASFAVMERLGVSTAVALDRHFRQFGWTILEDA